MNTLSPRYKPTVLCIDDDAQALKLRTAVLQRGGFEVLSAHDAGDALEKFETHKIDLVLSDHCLKGTTGVEIAKRMKRLNPAVPIVLYSGAPPESMGPVDCFILKSEEPTAVLERLHSLVCRSKA
jgi:CheY-like chemotaxis protein